ncbi:DUF4113 domain-containing protein [Pseudomonas cichorii]
MAVVDRISAREGRVKVRFSRIPAAPEWAMRREMTHYLKNAFHR